MYDKRASRHSYVPTNVLVFMLNLLYANISYLCQKRVYNLQRQRSLIVAKYVEGFGLRNMELIPTWNPTC